MEHDHFDRIARGLAAGVSRRSMLRRAAGSAMTTPLGLFGISAAAAQGNSNKNKDKDKGKEKDKGNQGNQGGADGGPGNSGCRGAGHPCEGNQVCCAGLTCGPDGPGNALRCSAGSSTTVETNQTVVNANNQVCAGDCAQTNQQAVLVENRELFGTPPSYWIDVACNYDAAKYQTVCDCVAFGAPGAPTVHTITLPPANICAFVITEEQRPAGAPRTGTNEETGGQANAGNGGVANADASGGSVTVGDISGNDANVAIDASGGTASADASGGDNNVAIAGSGQTGDAAAQAVELSTLTLTLEGNVAPGKLATYWVDTDAGRRPAQGPALVQVDDAPADTGAIIAEVRTCPIAESQPGYDWFGQCTAPAVDMPFTLSPATGGDGSLPASLATNAQGRARFGELPAGTYQLQPAGTVWCYAESDRVDENGNILVEPGVESHVWSFVCGGPRGS